MNNTITRLAGISQKESRIIAGLMSGTSLDGLDIAFCKVSGHGENTKVELIYFTTIAYDDETRSLIRQVFAKKNISSAHLCRLNAYLGKFHGQMVVQTLPKAGLRAEDVDLIASHGQTIFHYPIGSAWYPYSSTFQIGDGDHIARQTGIITISDFRQKHVAAGGEGAPLALYGERLLLRHENENRILLNLGGIGNITFLPSKQSILPCFTTDTGPANTLIDQYCQKHLNIPFDKNGDLARKGKINEGLLTAFKKHPFFSFPFPKSTGQEDFNIDWVEKILESTGLQKLQPTDVLATLTFLTSDCVVTAVTKSVPAEDNVSLYISGGGCHNIYLTSLIAQNLRGMRVQSLTEAGLDPDAKEAILFAVLANETIAGESKNAMVQSAEKFPEVHFGKISLPD